MASTRLPGHGWWDVRYTLVGGRRAEDAPAVRDALLHASASWSPNPFWHELPHEATTSAAAVACRLHDRRGRPALGGHWSATTDWQLDHRRGYEEDGRRDGAPPGGALDVTFQIWRTGESILHCFRLAQVIGAYDGVARLQMSWTGLRGRRLVAWADPRLEAPIDRVAVALDVRVAVELDVATVPERLADHLACVNEPVFAAFGGWTAPRELYASEARDLRRLAQC